MNIKHSDLVGTSILTSRGNELKIISHNGKNGNASKHLFYCFHCAKDTELFGSASFWSRINDIIYKKAVPCGCAYHPKWTEKQNIIRCERAAKEMGVVFKGWREQYKGNKTKIILYCPTHGFLRKNTINNLVKNKTGCRKCYEVKIRKSAISDRNAEKKYLPFCGYPEGATLKRIGSSKDEGARNTFMVYCPKCATDKYAQAGLCDGYFLTKLESLCSGDKACRCGKTKRKPESIAKYQCESLLENSGMEFIQWDNNYKNSRSYLTASCPKHGFFKTTPQLIIKGQRCPSCNIKKGYRTSEPGQIYLLESACRTMMKIGISNNFEQRVKELYRSTPFTFNVLAVKNMQGEAAPILERKLLERSTRLGLTGFNGSTEWVKYNNHLLEYFD